MTKRWLSLVLVLTLLSTLFTGVAFAEAYTVGYTTSAPETLTPGVGATVTLGTAAVRDEYTANVVVKQLEATSLYFNADGEWSKFGTVSSTEATVSKQTDTLYHITWKATFEPLMGTAPGTYEIATSGYGDIVATDDTHSFTIQLKEGSKPVGYYKIGAYTIEASHKSLNVGMTATLTLKYEGKEITDNVTWTSDKESVATVSENVVTAKDLGTATIAAKIGDTQVATIGITVTNQVMTPVIKPEPQTDGTYKVTITSATADAMIYYTVGKDTAAADPTDTTARKLYDDAFTISEAGNYEIRAIAYKGGMENSVEADKATFTVTITQEKVTVTPAAPTLTGRGTVQFSAAITPATASQKVKWSLENNADTYGNQYATIDQTGKVSVYGKRIVTEDTKITVKATALKADGSESELYGSATLLLKPQEAKGVTCDKEITIAQGETKTFKATVYPTNASNHKLNMAVDEKLSDTDLTGADAGEADPKTGVTTWTLGVSKDATVGDYTLTITAANGAGEKVTLHVVKPSATAPAPIFSQDSGTLTEDKTITITNPTGNTCDLVVFVNGEKKASFVEYDTTSLEDGKSVTISAYVEAKSPYTTDSEIVTKTYTKDLTVTGIELKAEEQAKEVTIKGAGTSTVTVTLTPDASKDKVTLTSSNTGVFTVKYDDKTGKATLTGVAPGTAKLNASAEDGKVTKSINVTVTKVDPDSIDVTVKGSEQTITTSYTLPQTQYVQLTAKVMNGKDMATDQSVTWSINDTKVATVSDGKVVAVGPGVATLTVTSKAKNSVETKVQITVPNTAVTKVAEPVLTPAGGTYDAKQTVKATCATEGATLYYTVDGTAPTTSDPVFPEAGIELTKDTTVWVLAVKSGLEDAYVKKSYTFNVPLKGVTLPATQTVQVGGTLQFTATLNPAEASVKTTTWSVDDNSLATIDSKGLLTAKDKAGNVVVTVTVTDKSSSGQKTANCLVTITEMPVVSMTMLPSAVTLNIRETQQLAYAATREAAKSTKGEWTSSDTKVATVNNSGLVTAKAAGTATITVTVDGKVGTATVTVLADPTSIPAKPTKAPTYTATPSTKVYSAMADSSLSVQVGTLTPATGTTLEQLFYYYTVTVTSDAIKAVDSSYNFVVAKDGAVYLNIPDVGKTSKFFDYTIKLADKDRGTDELNDFSTTVYNNTLSVTQKPSAINFNASTVADTSLEGGKTATLDFGAIANYADFTATGVAVTATANVSGTGVAATAAIDSNGKVTATVEGLVKGEYTVTVTLSASGCTSVTTGAAKVTVTSDKPAPVPVKKAIVVTKGTAYEGIKGVTQLAKADNYVTFDVAGLDEGVTVTSWKSSKPGYVAIDEHGIATLKKAGKAKITATMSDNSKLSIDVNVNKGSFADPADITLQTKPGNKWVDVTAEGITVVPKKSGQKSVPSRLNASDDGKIVIQDVEFSNGTIASRDGDNPSPIKVKKRSISDGETTTLTITANGAKFSVVIKVDSGAKDVYLEDVIAEIEEIIELEAE